MLSIQDAGNMDAATAALIIQMQLEELERLEENTKGKASSQRRPPDSGLARKIYHDELENMRRFLADQTMARSMEVAVRRDGQTIADFQTQERLATLDRARAREMAGLAVRRSESPMTTGVVSKHNELPTEPMTTVVVTLHNELPIEQPVTRVEPAKPLREKDRVEDTSEPPIAGPSRSSAHPKADHEDNSPRRIMCESCREEKLFFDVIQAPCNHGYCQACLDQLFELSMTDESLFPPRCCGQAITLQLAQSFLTPELIEKFDL